MARYYFYTDTASIGRPQSRDDAFGPIDDPIPLLEDRYRITNFHTRSNKDAAPPVIAVCDGKICIQDEENSPGTCTIILKPNYQPPFDFPYIKFFIFKGVDKTSLFDGDELKGIFTGGSSSRSSIEPEIPFVKRIWQGVENTSITSTADITGIKYDGAKEYKGEKIFSDDSPIDNFFYFQKTKDDLDNIEGQQLPLVRAGEVIGRFGNKVGFEIVLERLGYEPLIGFARERENILIVSKYQESHDPASNNADHFGLCHEKEACLNYIDPCAFYSGFGAVNDWLRYNRLRYKSSKAGTLKEYKCKKLENLYSEIISKFHNKGRVYLDIRSDHNFSMNYYKNYGMKIKFNSLDETDDFVFGSDSAWPIYIFDYGKLADIVEEKNSFARFKLQLPLGDNVEPIVFLSKAHARRFKNLNNTQRFLHHDYLKPADNGEFTSPITLSLPMYKNEFACTYYKINYYNNEKKEPSTGLRSGKKSGFDALFRPIDMVQTLKLSNSSLTCTLWHEEILVDLSNEGGATYIASVGIAHDENFVTLFCFPEFIANTKYSFERSRPLTSWTNFVAADGLPFLNKVFNEYNISNVVEVNVDNTDTVLVDEGLSSKGQRRYEYPENHVLLLMNHQEFESCVNAAKLLDTITIKDPINKDSDTDEPKIIKISIPIFIFQNAVSAKKGSESIDYNHRHYEVVGYEIISDKKLVKIRKNVDLEMFDYADT